MPSYEVHSVDIKTGVLVTSVIRTDGSMQEVRSEVSKGGLKPLKINVLDPNQAAIYERMRIMAAKRNLAGMSLSGHVVEEPKTRILWGRVAIAIALLAASLAGCLVLFL